ncbi:hypothetical protein CC86DRAFT_399402 [Ophiobolus disseminans]|uniref:Uncharacterized protein n=1 Tax=Ophiobolus disseminans TaxID=1469910 RepID=A0A6A6ZCQ9_9PLEO|nr:hypothetical protein CC86DRAFT_399402 [Ophiobolus disseminans]
MASHNNHDWLHVYQKEAKWFLMCGDALQNYPSTVLLIGTHEKEVAQAKLFPLHNGPKSRCLAHLSLNVATRDSDHPLLIASIDIDNAYNKLQSPPKHYGRIHHRVEWLSEQPTATSKNCFIDTVIGKLLLPFADVVCIFLDDFSIPEEAFHLLQRWTEAGKLGRSWKLQVIFVTSRSQMHRNISNIAMPGEVRHVRLTPANSKYAHLHRHRVLQNSILLGVKVVRKRRDASRLLFSATHLNVFFKLAVQRMASCFLPKFDFIVAARHLNPIDDQLGDHLQTFLKLCARNQTSQDFILRYLASIIILDSLPLGMHRGLIVLMFSLRRNIHECIEVFKHLAQRIFSRHNRFGDSVFAKLFGFLSSLLTDSLYGADEMEACVKEAFGLDARLFGSSSSNSPVSGLKIAVTIMTVSNSRLCILSNYNGGGVRQGNSSTSILLPRYLQDGGAGKHNNPIDPAEWEAQAIWDTVPDLALSIGTGYARDPGSPQVVSHRLRFSDRFFPRLFRLFNALLNAQDSWNDHLNRKKSDEKHKYFRINIPLDKEHPLDNVPVPSKHSTLCQGSIRCRSPDTRALLERISEQYPTASFYTEDAIDQYLRIRLKKKQDSQKTRNLYI